ncbi:MAG: hypothetical protein IPJ71_16865, partial [Bdellovibrionales bacterium]|nr:hypothetical protein [Bdellovibrionales bacterium]
MVALGILLWSQKLAYIDFRSMPGSSLVIAQAKISPAWAAFEDSRSSWENIADKLSVPKEKGILISSGTRTLTYEQLSVRINRQTQSSKEKKPANLPKIPQITVLNGIVISQRDVLVDSDSPPRVQVSNIDLDSSPMLKIAAGDGPGDSFLSKMGQEYQSPFTANERSELQKKAQELVSGELKRREKENQQPHLVPTESGGAIIVAKSSDSDNGSASGFWMSPGDRPGGQGLAKKPFKPDPGEPVLTAASLLTPADLAERNQNFVLSGRFSISGGLAYVAGAMRFELVHYLYDAPVAHGIIWENEAKFEIAVKELKGELSLRLVDHEGQILGIGTLPLHTLNLPPKNQIKISDISIPVIPAPLGAKIEIVSAYSIGTEAQIPLPKAKVEIQGLNRTYKSDRRGMVEDSDFLPGSNFLLRARLKNFWGSLMVGTSGGAQRIHLFPQKMVDALLGLLAKDEFERRDFLEKGIVWGRVVRDGQPVAGAVVELAGDVEVAPVYFNSIYIPDSNLIGTSSNGLFAFVGIDSGIQSVRARIGGVPHPARIILTEGKFVSIVELETETPVSSLIKVTSAPERKNPAAAAFMVMGTEIEQKVESEIIMALPRSNDLTLVEADGGAGTEIVRLNLDASRAGISVPMIPSHWLVDLATKKRINLEGGKGVVVGFVNNKDFEVFIDDREPYLAENTVYFDRDGQVLREGRGKAGGGFALFNLPTG